MEQFYDIIGSQKSKNKFAESRKHRPGDARDVNYETLSPREKLFEIRRNTKQEIFKTDPSENKEVKSVVFEKVGN